MNKRQHDASKQEVCNCGEKLHYRHRTGTVQKVAAAYAELYELENILVLDVGRYGFVKLQYYTPEYGFNDVITYTDSESMFEDLWQEWLDTRLYLFAKGTPMLEMGYEEIFKCLPEEKQKELLEQKAVFAKMAEIELK